MYQIPVEFQLHFNYPVAKPNIVKIPPKITSTTYRQIPEKKMQRPFDHCL